MPNPSLKPDFRCLLENLPAGAYTCDKEGLITYFNEHAVKIWGRAPAINDPLDRFCGSFKLFSADGTPISHDECWMALALRTGQRYDGMEVVIERPDGSRTTALAHVSPIFDEAGELAGAMNVLVDISDRKQNQDANDLLAAIVESSDDAIVSKTLEGRILTWNKGAEQLYGYTPDEAIGQPITLIIPPELHDEEQSILAKIRRGERLNHYETQRVSKAGRHIEVSLTISPMRDATGRVVGASKIARDITARKRAETMLVTLKDEFASQVIDLRRLQEMSVRLSTSLELQPILFETLRTAAAIEGTDLGILSLCEGEKNYLQIVSLGFDAEILKTLDHVPLGAAACGTCFQERRRIIVENIETDPLFAPYREVARQAGIRAVHSTPLITRSGKIVGVLSTHFRQPHVPSDRVKHLIDLCARQAVDFIENARLYEQLREADRSKDEFLATLAHELRNPLAPISNSLHLLKLFDDVGPSTQRVHEIMERQVNCLVRLVDDLLEVSRITRGKIELHKERVDLASILAGAVETSRPLVDAANHQLAISLPPEPLSIEVDAVRLTQVIANVLNNAAKYTPEGGQIWLTAHRDASDVVISVRDTGLGIPAEVLPRVFDMFAQGDRTLTRAQGGLGIGLTLAKNLVELHGGSILAHSAGPGLGSEFVVRIPLAQAAQQAAKLARSQPVGNSIAGCKVLIVDDSRDALFVLGKMLEAMGQQVRIAHTAASAIEQARAERPDLIISDIAMPDMNGYQMAKRLRQEPGLEDIVLVALTGYGQESDRQGSRQAGFDYHLVKPVRFEALRDLLARVSAPRPAASTPGE